VVDIKTFGANIYMLIGLLLCIAATLVLAVVAWTFLKAAVWRARQKVAEEQERRQKLQPDGTPYPPLAPGVCQRCQRARDAVYHLPSGQRLCRDCYAAASTTSETSRHPGR
jgi:hypothetical protein